MFCSKKSEILYDSFKSFRASQPQKWLPFSYTDYLSLEEGYRKKNSTQEATETKENILVLDHKLFQVDLDLMIMKPYYWEGHYYEVRRSKWFFKGDTCIIPCPSNLEVLLEGSYKQHEHFITSTEEIMDEPEGDDKSEKISNKNIFRKSKKFSFVEMDFEDEFSFMKVHFIAGRRERAYVHDKNGTIKIAKSFFDFLPISKSIKIPSYKFCRGMNRFRETANKYNNQIKLLNNPISEKYSNYVRSIAVGEYSAQNESCEYSNLLFVVHGIGQKRYIKKDGDVFSIADMLRSTFDGLAKDPKKKFMVLPIEWRTRININVEDTIRSHQESEKFESLLNDISLRTIPKVRGLFSEILLDVLLYMSPAYSSVIVDTATEQLNNLYDLFVKANPHFKGKISFLSHSLGSVITFDIVTNQKIKTLESQGSRESFLNILADWMPTPFFSKAPESSQTLKFPVENVFAIGSPLGVFILLKGLTVLGGNDTETHKLIKDLPNQDMEKIAILSCKNIFNFADINDPVAYRLEPLFCREAKDEPASLLPCAQGRSLSRTRSNSAAKSHCKIIIKHSQTLEPIKEIDKDGDNKVYPEEAPISTLFKFNNYGRVDYQFCSSSSIIYNQYLNSISAHSSYWTNDSLLAFISNIMTLNN
ncbi:hypothetical protein O9G_001781 [Rozella allomycis CSF55]|uniref:DDHD domain-containing protein n=1 Tax=Rozella allomycis (strain CSF55) TaxID=988480 RepID=A0A075AW97_ROZAC|nr:hypothetical protein O9G_001781 [Rozella allomycis CSF55]|eukprot:EPZ34525.1 hypothetical protein O9G_001781 [Rozella allomycis CSF55]